MAKTAEGIWAKYRADGWWIGPGWMQSEPNPGRPSERLLAWTQERRKLHRSSIAQCPHCAEYRQKYGEHPSDDLLRMCRTWIRVQQAPASATRVRRTQRLRNEIPKALWWEILERDDFRCQHCGVRRFLTVDHIIALDNGGTNEPENLQTLCRNCNSRKGNR